MVFEISILHLHHHKIPSNTSSMEVDLVVYKNIVMKDLWDEWKWKFERIDEENERKRKCVETEEINQINLIVLLFSSFSDDFWLIWSNEWSWDQMNRFCNNIVQIVFFRENFYWKFLSYKNSFYSICIKKYAKIFYFSTHILKKYPQKYCISRSVAV